MVEPTGNISSVLGVVLQVGKWLAAPIGRQFMYLYNYNTNFDNLQEEVNRLKDAKDRVDRKVDAAERNVEEIEGNVKKWQNDVEKTIVQAERLIQDKSNNPCCLKGLCPNLETRYKHSKKAFKSKWDDIGPLLLQEEKFDRVSYPTIPPDDKNFDKLGDDVLKLTNARRKVQRKVEEARNNEEEIEEDVKKWLEDVDSIIVKAEELIKNQSSIGTDRKTRYQNIKAASELMVEDIGPLLHQEERFHKVSYSTIQQSDSENNFDKLGDDVSKLKNARRKVQRKVEEAKNNVEEIEEDVKKWLEDVDSIIVKAEELIENQSSIGTDRETRYQNSKAASELMVDNISPLLQQGERFDKVSHPKTNLPSLDLALIFLALFLVSKIICFLREEGSAFSKEHPCLAIGSGNMGEAWPPLILPLFLNLRLREIEREIWKESLALPGLKIDLEVIFMEEEEERREVKQMKSSLLVQTIYGIDISNKCSRKVIIFHFVS